MSYGENLLINPDAETGDTTGWNVTNVTVVGGTMEATTLKPAIVDAGGWMDDVTPEVVNEGADGTYYFLLEPVSEIVVDTLNESYMDSDWCINAEDGPGVGQSFTAIAGDLSSCKFYLKKQGSPTGNAVAKLYTHSGVYGTSSVPTGVALATSDNFDVSTLTIDFALTTLTFSGVNQYTLVNGAKYVITFEFAGGNGSNSVLAGIDDFGVPAHSGNLSGLWEDAWFSTNGIDLCFYVYRLKESSIMQQIIYASDIGVLPDFDFRIDLDFKLSVAQDLEDATVKGWMEAEVLYSDESIDLYVIPCVLGLMTTERELTNYWLRAVANIFLREGLNLTSITITIRMMPV